MNASPTAVPLDPEAVERLRAEVSGPVFVRGDAEFAAEMLCFNTTTVHEPDLVVGAESDGDVQAAVRFAAAAGLPLRIQATGHGEGPAITDGVIISTKRMDAFAVDPATRLATIGAGVHWAAVIAAAAEYGLAPITGASGTVGAIGYTLGGGIGPLSRSYGFTSDWVRGFQVVTADGELVTADATTHSDLFWALRGGRGGLGVVTEMTIELVPLTTLYAGSLFFEGPENIEKALRVWTDWVETAPDDATTSVAFLRIPDVEFVPPPFRGRSLLTLRFAYPGDAAEGERLLAPLRAGAPVYLDAVAEIPAAAVGTIHNDPENPGPSKVYGTLLSGLGQEAATRLLTLVGPEADSPFVSAELRHLGAATTRDVVETSAVGGRDGAFTLTLVAVDPATFATQAPAVAAAVADATRTQWANVTNINFSGTPWTNDPPVPAWPAPILERLRQIRAEYDPAGLFVQDQLGRQNS